MSKKDKALLDKVGLSWRVNERIRAEHIRSMLTQGDVSVESLMGEIHSLLSYRDADAALLLLELAWGRPDRDYRSDEENEDPYSAVADKAWKVLCQKLFSPSKDLSGREEAENTTFFWMLIQKELLKFLIKFFIKKRDVPRCGSQREKEIVARFLKDLVRCGWKFPRVLFSRYAMDKEEADAVREQLVSYRPDFIQILLWHDWTSILLENDVWQNVTDDDMETLAKAFVRGGSSNEHEPFQVGLSSALTLGLETARVYVMLRELREADRFLESLKQAK